MIRLVIISRKGGPRMGLPMLVCAARSAISAGITVSRRCQNPGPGLLFGNAVGLAILFPGFVVLTFASSLSLLATPY